MDNHATTPVDPRVLEVMLPYFTRDFGNSASSDHLFGARAAEAVEDAREQIARTVNSRPEEIVFTSGATESDNLAIQGVSQQYLGKGNHIITCSTEHKAVLDTCKHLSDIGYDITYLPVDRYGLIDLERLEAAITEKTILISIMAANNEIGTIAPISEIGSLAHRHGVLFHTDATQAIGHIRINVEEMNIDLLSMSAHKVYGPKGIGALYVRRRNPKVKVTPILFGGGHERGMRSGTLNVPGIVGFGEALRLSRNEMDAEGSRFGRWSAQMLGGFKDRMEGIELNGHPTLRLPHNLNVSFGGIESKALIRSIHNEVSVSAGSACTSDIVEPSHVLVALGLGEGRAHSSVRFGLGRFNTEEEIAYATDCVPRAAVRLKKMST